MNEKSCKLIGFGPGWGRRDYRQFEDIFVFHDVIANLKLIIDMLKVTSYKTHTHAMLEAFSSLFC